MRRVVATLAVLLALTNIAAADRKSRQTARILSGASSAVAGGVVLSGFLFTKDSKAFNEPVLYTGLGLLAVAPSAGEIYAEQYLTIGMGVRAVGAGFALWVTQSQVETITCDTAKTSEQKCEQLTGDAAPLLGIAAIIFIGGTWYDVLDAGDAADRYNQRNGFTVVPTALAAPQGLVPGLALSGTF